jgi:hypothetical protein
MLSTRREHASPVTIRAPNRCTASSEQIEFVACTTSAWSPKKPLGCLACCGQRQNGAGSTVTMSESTSSMARIRLPSILSLLLLLPVPSTAFVCEFAAVLFLQL